MDLRDLWDKEDCQAQKSISALKTLLGLPINVQLEPSILWNELQKYFPDQNTFVPSITAVVKAWVDCLADRLADDANAAWTEQLLDYVNETTRTLKARVEVSLAAFSFKEDDIMYALANVEQFYQSRPGSQVRTELAKSGAAFIIGIPESPPPYRNVFGFFMSELEKLFTQSSNQASSAQAQGAEDEDWANVTLPSRIRRQTIDMASTVMPSLPEISRPESLFAAQTPYHLIVRVIHNGMVVQGSHQGSLELLAGYLQKYTRDVENISVKVIYEFRMRQ